MINIGLLGDRFLGMFKERPENTNNVVLRLEVDFLSYETATRWTIFNGSVNGDGEDTIFVIQKEREKGSRGVTAEVYHVLGVEGVVTYEDLVNHAKSIIDFNMELEEKKILLREKIDELTQLFQEYPTYMLRHLRFNFPHIYPAETSDTTSSTPDNTISKSTNKRGKKKQENTEELNLESTESNVILEDN